MGIYRAINMRTMRFLAEVKERGRITIPYAVRKYLKISEGTLVHVEVVNVSGQEKLPKNTPKN